MSAEFKNNKGFCIWLTGLPCAGKTKWVKIFKSEVRI